jgi:hypothetical protein
VGTLESAALQVEAARLARVRLGLEAPKEGEIVGKVEAAGKVAIHHPYLLCVVVRAEASMRSFFFPSVRKRTPLNSLVAAQGRGVQGEGGLQLPTGQEPEKVDIVHVPSAKLNALPASEVRGCSLQVAAVAVRLLRGTGYSNGTACT